MSAYPASAQSVDRHMPIRAFGLSLSFFFAITYLVCVSLRIVVPDVGNHLPRLQFLPGFEWTLSGMMLRLIESVGYGWYVALVFGALFSFFVSRRS